MDEELIYLQKCIRLTAILEWITSAFLSICYKNSIKNSKVLTLYKVSLHNCIKSNLCVDNFLKNERKKNGWSKKSERLVNGRSYPQWRTRMRTSSSFLKKNANWTPFNFLANFQRSDCGVILGYCGPRLNMGRDNTKFLYYKLYK